MAALYQPCKKPSPSYIHSPCRQSRPVVTSIRRRRLQCKDAKELNEALRGKKMLASIPPSLSFRCPPPLVPVATLACADDTIHLTAAIWLHSALLSCSLLVTDPQFLPPLTSTDRPVSLFRLFSFHCGFLIPATGMPSGPSRYPYKIFRKLLPQVA